MPDILKTQWRKARKRHTCSYCNEYIEPGEKYRYDVLKYEGCIYDWFSHEKCAFIADELWDFATLDDAMTADDFQEACRDFCVYFICLDCKSFRKDDGECVTDDCNYIDEIYKMLKGHELYCAKEDNWRFWKLRPRKDSDNNGET